MALQVVVTTPRSRCAINVQFDVATTVAIITRVARCIRPYILIAVTYVSVRYSVAVFTCAVPVSYKSKHTLNFEEVPVDHFKHKSYQLYFNWTNFLHRNS